MSYHQTGAVRAIVHHRVDGLGEVALGPGDVVPAGTQVLVSFQSDNAISASWATLDSALSHYQLDGKSWIWTPSAPFRHTVKVQVERAMSRGEIGAAIISVFRSYGGTGARSFTYKAPYLPSDFFTRGSAPPPPSPPTAAGPVPVQSASCTNMGGRCYDFSRPPSNLPAGQWVRGKCDDVPGLQTRCYVPASAQARRPGGAPPATPADEIRMASPPIFGSGSGEDIDPAKAFMIGGLVLLGGVLVYVGWTQWKKRRGMQAAVSKTSARALPRATNRRRRRRNGGADLPFWLEGGHRGDEPKRRFYLERIRLDSQGYDRHGRYWGVGRPLFQYDDGGQLIGEVRADDRRHAKELVRRRLSSYPFTVFFTQD